MAEKTLREAYKDFYEELKKFMNAEYKEEDFTESNHIIISMEQLTLKYDLLGKMEERSMGDDYEVNLNYKIDFDDLFDFVDAYMQVPREAWSDDINELVDRYLNGDTD
jgi:hypothetical protein